MHEISIKVKLKGITFIHIKFNNQICKSTKRNYSFKIRNFWRQWVKKPIGTRNYTYLIERIKFNVNNNSNEPQTMHTFKVEFIEMRFTQVESNEYQIQITFM